MYKYLIIIFFYNFSGYGQKGIEKVIYVSDNSKVILVFDSPIKQGTVGSQEYFFGYDTKIPNKIGNIIAIKGAKATNLFIVTEDKRMYSFILKFKETLKHKEFVYQFDVSNALNFKYIKPLPHLTTDIDKGLISSGLEIDNTSSSSSITNENYDFHRSGIEIQGDKSLSDFCDTLLLKTDAHFRQEFKIVDDVYFGLKAYYYKEDKVYFHFELDNKSNIDFDINFIRFFTTTRKKSNRSLSQQIFLGKNGLPDYMHKLRKRVRTKEKFSFICVFSKFSLNRNKSLLVNLSELKGERVIELEFNSRVINNPEKI